MAGLRRWFLICCLLLNGGLPLWAASSSETRTFNAAVKQLQDGLYEQAEAGFAGFAQKFSASPRVPEAVLLQAEARIRLGRYAPALELLATRAAQAGNLADEYLFWEAEARFGKGDFEGADAAFGKFLQQYGASPRCIDAAVHQAAACMKLGRSKDVITLLAPTNSLFQAAAHTNQNKDLVASGFLLLSDASVALADLSAAAAALRPLAEWSLAPTNQWQRSYLQCRILLAQGQLEAALGETTNLQSLATLCHSTPLQIETAAFRAGLLERLGRPDQAAAAYERNLADDVPEPRRREALLKIRQLLLEQNKVADAAQRFEQFLARYPKSSVADLALLTIGELRLRQHETGVCTNLAATLPTNAPPATNCLERAVAALQDFTRQFPQSLLRGNAELYLGRGLWLQGRLAESQAAFQTAVERLPLCPDQATAYFKLGDAQFQQGNYAAALDNYNAIIDKYAAAPDVRSNLFEQALYQIVQAGLRGGNLAAATNALISKLLAWYPNGTFAESALLLTGQELSRKDPIQARKLLMDFTQSAPGARRLPELKLAIACTFEQQELWAEAITQYDDWLARYTNHSERASAEYSRAYANYQAERETNAFILFTNFIVNYPTNELAQRAQWWVACYYDRTGKPLEAEKSFQWVYQNTNWPATSLLAYQARLRAGRAAFARQAWEEARRDYFTKLVNDTNCPADLRAQAYFALGDTLVSQSFTNIPEALVVYEQVYSQFPTNRLAPLAWGARAYCYYQSQDYASASNAYQKVLESPRADVAARSNAKVGLGLTLEAMAAQQKTPEEQQRLLKLACAEYCAVVYDEDFLRDGEAPDPFWTIKAGMQAASLLNDRLNDHAAAVNVYKQLRKLFPSSRLVKEKLNALAQSGG